MSYQDVLAFWFGPLDENGDAGEAHAKRWWRKDPAFDQELRDRFETLHGEIMRGEHDDWLASPRGRVAAIIVLDQFSRNMFRGTPKMFASDARALELAEEGVALGIDRALGRAERQFFYMPFMHSERIDAQERGVDLFTAWRSSLEGEARDKIAVKYAEQHRDIVKRFGRFPHRNATLGRESTPEELEFLKQPGSSF